MNNQDKDTSTQNFVISGASLLFQVWVVHPCLWGLCSTLKWDRKLDNQRVVIQEKKYPIKWLNEPKRYIFKNIWMIFEYCNRAGQARWSNYFWRVKAIRVDSIRPKICSPWILGYLSRQKAVKEVGYILNIEGEQRNIVICYSLLYGGAHCWGVIADSQLEMI